MRIKQITIHNLLSFKDQTITFPQNHLVIVGPNNTGKSNIFRLLDLMLKEMREASSNTFYFFNRNLTPILTIHLELSKEEVSAIINFLCYNY